MEGTFHSCFSFILEMVRINWGCQEYYSELHGVVFVVDSADSARFEEAKDALWGILNDDRATGAAFAHFLCFFGGIRWC